MDGDGCGDLCCRKHNIYIGINDFKNIFHVYQTDADYVFLCILDFGG